MMHALSLIALAACYGRVLADQTPGNYSQPWRPQVHFSPPYGFMNDPNGLFIDGSGTYHLYYQLNPDGLTGGDQHWGHATSTDLLSWTNQAIAISPESDAEQIYTGSAVIDANNTSGYFPNQSDGLVAVYTLNTATSEAQDIAYSTDGGFSFTKEASNPVIDVGSNAFRDPKVVWYAPTQSWVAAISFANADQISVWTSPDLKAWTNVSNFTSDGLSGVATECPNMIPMPMLANGSATDANDLLDPSNIVADASYWLMWISTSGGGPGGGTVERYVAGTFDGTTFAPVDGLDLRLTDFAMDNYAGQFFYGGPAGQPPVGMQWASNGIYTNDVPTDTEGFRGSQSLPRRYAFANTTGAPFTLIAQPVPLDGLHTTSDPLVQNTTLANAALTYGYGADVPSGALSLTLVARGLDASSAGSMNFTFSASSTGESVAGGAVFQGGNALVFLDRSNTDGYTGNPSYILQFTTTQPLDPDTGRFEIQAVIDRSIMDVFLDQGVQSATSVFFSNGALDTLDVVSGGLPDGVTIEADLWGLKSGWS